MRAWKLWDTVLGTLSTARLGERARTKKVLANSFPTALPSDRTCMDSF